MSFSILSFLKDDDTKTHVPWESKKYTEGETIVIEGTQGMEVFFIISGTVDILASMTIAKEQQKDKGIARLSTNEFFGELSIFDNNTRSATAVATSDCEIAVIDGAALLSYMDSNPEKGYQVLYYFLHQITQRMRSNNIRANTIMEFYLQEQEE